MAACSELEEKASSSEDTLLRKIFLEESSNRNSEELSNKLSEEATTGDLTALSDDEFLHLLKEASTFDKRNNKESDLLIQLRKEVAIKEPLENDSVDERSEHKQSKIYLCNSVSSSAHRTVDGKKKTKHCGDFKNALNSDKNVQQSLSLQDLLCPESKSKKSHKAHRTLSLSSEEAADLLSDAVLSKTAKKSNKQFNSSKSSSWKCNVKPSVGGDASQKHKLDAAVHNSPLPYEPITNECDIPLPDNREDGKLKSASGCPVEIEMDDITKADEDEVDRLLLTSQSVEKVNKLQSNSKFYVDSNELVENGQVDFPLSSWTSQPMQVQSLLQSLPLDPDAYRGDKQLLSPDINGNPFYRSSRPSLTSFLSTSIMDYNTSNMMSENKNRKNKRLRNAVNKGVLSENIAGHRGEEDIDTLLQYINSSDKKCKSVKGASQNQLLSNKGVFHENDKKKMIGKDVKNYHKNIKKLSRSNSLENLMSNSRQQDKSNSLSYESNAILDKPLKSSKSPSAKRILDINSNVETQFSNFVEKGEDLEKSVRLSGCFKPSSPEVSSFAADFYSTADVSSQTVEESGFLIVKKKKRRNHQSKRSEYRWRSNQTPHKKGMMIPLAESKCGKQDSRRKSTSSVPHSEHSSADNSDLDSVHSLPVRGSVRPPKQPHPHTTPSSSSSTPQASYADIARMPIPKLSPPSPCVITYSAQSPVAKQQLCNYELQKTVKQAPSKNSSCVDDCICSEMKVRSFTKSTREINTQTEPEISTSETDAARLKKSEELSKIVCNVCFCPLKRNCSCSKSQSTLRPKMKPSDIPPVIMDNMPAETNTCNVSFGFGVDEVLQMTPTKQSECKDSRSSSVVVNKNQTADDSFLIYDSHVSAETSSHLHSVCYGTGRNICYSETQVNTKKFNLSEITHFLGMEFRYIEKELGVSKSNSIGSKIMYYADSAEEA